jgi:hypothetical protein
VCACKCRLRFKNYQKDFTLDSKIEQEERKKNAKYRVTVEGLGKMT